MLRIVALLVRRGDLGILVGVLLGVAAVVVAMLITSDGRLAVLLGVVIVAWSLVSQAQSVAIAIPVCPVIPRGSAITTPRLILRMPVRADRARLAATIDDDVRTTNGWRPTDERDVLDIFRMGGRLAGDAGRLVITDLGGAVIGEI